MLELDLSDVKPSLFNWVIVGLMAVTFIAASKFVVNHYDNPITAKFKDLLNAV